MLSKKIVILLLSMCVLFAFCGCNSQQHEPFDMSTQAIPLQYVVTQYGNYIYYDIAGVLFRYHIDTGEFSYACMDATCEHTFSSDCPLTGIRGIAFIENNALFYSYEDVADNKYYYASYSLTDSSVQILKQCSGYEDYNSTFPKTDGEYIYYTYRKLKDGGNADVLEDYILGVFRQPLEGGQEEHMCNIEENMILSFVQNGRLIFTQNGCSIISSALDGSNRQVLFQEEACPAIGGLCYFKNQLFFLACDGTFDITLNQIKAYHYELISVNLETGEYKRLLDEYVSKFRIADEQIYYLRYDLKTLYKSENVNNPSNVFYVQDFTWRACDIQGNDSRDLYTNETILYHDNINIINGILYGEVQFYDYVSNQKSMPTFIQIDLKRGKLAKIADMSDYLNIQLVS